MELVITIEHIEHDIYNEGYELDNMNKAANEAEKTILEYSKIGLLPRVGETVCAITFDHVFEITRIAYCEWKIMIECKLA